MPLVNKEALSKFIRTDCRRQLRLNLSPDTSSFRHEREENEMPPIQPPRPGLEHLAQAGELWQSEKIADLSDTFGETTLIGNRHLDPNQRSRFSRIELIDYLPSASAGNFIIEAEFDVGSSFEQELGIANYRSNYHLEYSRLRPDIIEVLAPQTYYQFINPDGTLNWINEGDTRLQLRIIDIKLTAEPSPSYFTEITYYSMVLAGWLNDHNLNENYVVVPNAAIWPGSHDASNLVRFCQECEQRGHHPVYAELINSFQEDLEVVPFEVFSGRVKNFFQIEIPAVLNQPWQDLPFHVDNRCKGCDYIGYPWLDRHGRTTNHHLQCIPTAENINHLSRIAFITRGASNALAELGITDVDSLAQLPPTNTAFDSHFSLRAGRYVISGRASSLRTNLPTIPPQTGTSAVMPRWADLHIYLSADFDLGSAITFCLGIEAFWVEPFGSPGPRQMQHWGPFTFVVDRKDVNVEQRELLYFLNRINTILNAANALNNNTTVQFYLWDNIQYNHLTRIVGRHLPIILANNTLAHLAWLFPPEELLPNPRLETRRSPITIVRDVVKSLLAAPIPHYYTLFQIARVYHHNELAQTIARFSIHPLFEDPLSDQIPSERAHEIWAHTENWNEIDHILRETVRKKLIGIQTITRRLEFDLGQDLAQIAPRINIQPPQRAPNISFDGQLWYGFSRLNSALDELEIHQIRAMPPNERTSRFKSARLTRQLFGQEETDALAHLGIHRRNGRRVYILDPDSREVKLREGNFDFALSPENDPGFLDRSFHVVTEGTPLQPPDGSGWRMRMERVCSVTIVAIDRENELIAIDPNNRNLTIFDDLERNNITDFTTNAILDPCHLDTFTKKLLDTLQEIGNPQNARNTPFVRQAVGLTNARRSRITANNPAGDILWDAHRLANLSNNENLSHIRESLERNEILLNPSQWRAWELGLNRRLQLIWGPPGTGKTRTLQAIILGAVLRAYNTRTSLRILICAPTYNALDNVLLEVNRTIYRLIGDDSVQIIRIRSSHRPRDIDIPVNIDIELNRANPSHEIRDLKHRLDNNRDITIVGTTPEQIHNLLTSGFNPARQELFDLIAIDEASQMDIEHAILPIASASQNSSLIIAGDPLQLPPIQKAKPPLGLEEMVGSVYRYFERIHHLEPAVLQNNYRSNQTIVEFAHEAGYPRALTSNSPNLTLNLENDASLNIRPPNWPHNLYWTSNWSLLLNPRSPVNCFIYPEGRSGQWNRFESESVAALSFLLFRRLRNQLLNEHNPITGQSVETSDQLYSDEEFWRRGLGIVTPHRAQQALIVTRLQQIFSPLGVDNSLIRDAVDTVERFQGQQRDIIIASYALGDPDAIGDEDEFLMSLNRFNVMASRARAKLLVFVSQEVVNHLSGDLEVLRQSRLLKTFAESFCNRYDNIQLGYLQNDIFIPINGMFRYRQ